MGDAAQTAINDGSEPLIFVRPNSSESVLQLLGTIITVSTRSAPTCSNLTACRRQSGSPSGRPWQYSSAPAR